MDASGDGYARPGEDGARTWTVQPFRARGGGDRFREEAGR